MEPFLVAVHALVQNEWDIALSSAFIWSARETPTKTLDRTGFLVDPAYFPHLNLSSCDKCGVNDGAMLRASDPPAASAPGPLSTLHALFNDEMATVSNANATTTAAPETDQGLAGRASSVVAVAGSTTTTGSTTNARSTAQEPGAPGNDKSGMHMLKKGARRVRIVVPAVFAAVVVVVADGGGPAGSRLRQRGDGAARAARVVERDDERVGTQRQGHRQRSNSGEVGRVPSSWLNASNATSSGARNGTSPGDIDDAAANTTTTTTPAATMQRSSKSRRHRRPLGEIVPGRLAMSPAWLQSNQTLPAPMPAGSSTSGASNATNATSASAIDQDRLPVCDVITARRPVPARNR
ncbi:unnamed protein product (mitochondrion) [Plasmodiophora brassicae]|uniref:Uncharacterized protein n=1 Tax=Plasmodiophora brassicae TaxID=37360 RepID=A0A3P3YJD9_PLABS|nr:unnamed protein product [Plasmodiophora brassicae]